jgi:hypothetical protein
VCDFLYDINYQHAFLNSVTTEKRNFHLLNFDMWCWRKVKKEQLAGPYDKCRSIAQAEEGKEYPTYREKKG